MAILLPALAILLSARVPARDDGENHTRFARDFTLTKNYSRHAGIHRYVIPEIAQRLSGIHREVSGETGRAKPGQPRQKPRDGFRVSLRSPGMTILLSARMLARDGDPAIRASARPR